MESLNFDLLSIIISFVGLRDSLLSLGTTCVFMHVRCFRAAGAQLLHYGRYANMRDMVGHFGRPVANSHYSVVWRALADVVVLFGPKISSWLHLLHRCKIDVEERATVRWLLREVLVHQRYSGAGKLALSAAHVYLVARFPLCFYGRGLFHQQWPGWLSVVPVAQLCDTELTKVYVHPRFGDWTPVGDKQSFFVSTRAEEARLHQFPQFIENLQAIDSNQCLRIMHECVWLGPHPKMPGVELSRNTYIDDPRLIFCTPHLSFPQAHLWTELFNDLVGALPAHGATELLDRARCGTPPIDLPTSKWLLEHIGAHVIIPVERLGDIRASQLARAGVARSSIKATMRSIHAEIHARKQRHSVSLFRAVQRYVASVCGYPKSPISLAVMTYQLKFHRDELVRRVLAMVVCVND